jgi:hypothetical protein
MHPNTALEVCGEIRASGFFSEQGYPDGLKWGVFIWAAFFIQLLCAHWA